MSIFPGGQFGDKYQIKLYGRRRLGLGVIVENLYIDLDIACILQ
jgi:hypothetical protein